MGVFEFVIEAHQKSAMVEKGLFLNRSEMCTMPAVLRIVVEDDGKQAAGDRAAGNEREDAQADPGMDQLIGDPVEPENCHRETCANDERQQCEGEGQNLFSFYAARSTL